MQQIALRLKTSALRGLKSGARTWWWIVRMMLPITLGVAVLQWLGAIALLSEWLSPMFSHIGLSGEGVLVFITALLSSIYAAIGVMGTLDMDYRSVTIIAVMTLVAHNLIVESLIQRKAGSNAWVMATLRIVAAIVVAWVINALLPADYAGRLLIERTAAGSATLPSIMTTWAISNGKLLPLMFGMIVGLQVLQQILREFRLIERLTVPLRPLMRIFGLSDRCSFLWVVLNTLGLAYGGSVMIAEIEAGNISPREARDLNAHAAMTHSTLEDTLLYAALGIGIGWLLIPRVVLAIVVVWSWRGIEKLRNTIENYDNNRTDQRACKTPGCVEEVSLTSTANETI